MIKQLRERFGLNMHVLATLVFRGWSIGAGGITLFLLPATLDPTEQGYYYTFASVLALQIFFELGLNQVVMQFVSHEVAHLRFAANGQLCGDDQHIDRFGSLAKLIRKWYSVAALLFLLVAGGCGLVFFRAQGTLPLSTWIGVWAVLVASTAANLYFSPTLAVFEGCGRIGEIARLRLHQSMLGYCLLWLGLAANLGLWAVVAVPLTSAIFTGAWLRRYGQTLAWLRRRDFVTSARLSWSADIFPLQWRIAISWVSGYFIFNLFTPIVFSHWGPAEAGKIGLALAIFSSISTLGMSWVNANAPTFAMHISRGERSALNTLFLGVLKRSTAVTALASIGLLGAVWLLRSLGWGLVERLAALDVLACLAMVTAVNSVVFSLAVYMRAHKEEPMLPVSVGSAVFTVVAVYFGARYNLLVMMASYLLVTVLLTLPWTLYIFSGFFKRVDR